MTNETIALVAAFLTFLGGVAGSWVLWHKNRSDDDSQIRRDLFTMNAALTKSVKDLEIQVNALRERLIEKSQRISQLETKLDIIKMILIKHNIEDETLIKLMEEVDG